MGEGEGKDRSHDIMREQECHRATMQSGGCKTAYVLSQEDTGL